MRVNETKESVTPVNSILKEKSYSTAKKAYNNLNSCFELGVQRGEILKNPVRGVKLPPAKQSAGSEVINYEPDEVAAIVEEAKRTYKNGAPVYRYGYLIILLLNTGMREGRKNHLPLFVQKSPFYTVIFKNFGYLHKLKRTILFLMIWLSKKRRSLYTGNWRAFSKPPF